MLAAACLLTVPHDPQPTSQWKLVFADEFDGKKGSPVNPKHWVHDLGGSGWGNNVWEFYTDGAKNAFLDGKSHLIIEARKEAAGGKDYTSARIKTKGLVSLKFGKIEARLKLPVGQGIWPAFWMLGDDIDKVGWPQCGEIDIMESLGQDPKTVYGTIHGPGYSGSHGPSKKLALKPAPAGANGFHTYGIEWEPGRITWFVDGEKSNEWTKESLKGKEWVYDQSFFLLLNVAVGGDFPGYPDATTKFPQRLMVDYVRAYERVK